ncbi:winged helix-turn-helix domain-containing protein [Streptomyces sp. ZAF1911]|uniref:winged helix-turn-helix domain-containing protein n=1 Tax=Streptomyces sp. ZAF1911 TaxID=2944129 RepID=UPI00237B7AED|nr:winged helix-turn-helix domain-containing protein [Streptomyces sp. ZAF1911]MDD9380279.1 winged helix-turn-helix domain-containing protein [Streptomyces sp. ZAF1911]
MTTALPAPATPPRRSPASRLQLVGDRPTVLPAHGTAGGRVGYLVFLPANVDPVEVMASHGVRPEVHPLEPVHADDAIRIDRERRLVELAGRELELTYLEFDLLAHFVAHPHTVHTRDALISGIWGYGHVGDGRTVDVHVARLRRKLGPAYRGRISTVRRVGYKYVPDHQ